MKLFLFAHIEKCGGTSVHNFLEEKIGRYLILRPTPGHGTIFTNNQLKLIRKLHPKLLGFGGHRIRICENYEDVGTTYTVLRDPYSRYLSHARHQVDRGIVKNIESFVEDTYFDNFMCKRICGEESSEKAIELLERKEVIVHILERDLKTITRKNEFRNTNLKVEIDAKIIQGKNKEDQKLYSYFLGKQVMNLDELSEKITQKYNRLNIIEKRFYQRVSQRIVYLLTKNEQNIKVNHGR